MVTQDEVHELLEFYRKDFRVRTGCELFCIPDKELGNDKSFYISQIVYIACEYFNVPKKTVTNPNRESGTIQCRQMIAAMLVNFNCTHKVIAAKFGNMERSTVTTMLMRYNKLMKEDEEYKKTWENFRVYCKRKLEAMTYYEKQENDTKN